MAHRRPTAIPPDWLDTIVAETQRRLSVKRGPAPQLRASIDVPAPANADPAPALADTTARRRTTMASHALFLWIMLGILTLSVSFGVFLGLCVMAMILAFTIAPVTASVLMGGILALIGLFYLHRFIGRLSGRASEKADYIRAQKKLRPVKRT